MRYVSVISGVVAALAFAATASAGPIEDKAKVPVGGAGLKEVYVAIEISEKSFHITKGATEKGITLMAGMPAAIQLHNKDLVAHEFMSTLFRDVPFRITGNATLVKTARASGVRVDPGQTVTLEFDAPLSKQDEYGAIESTYDVFWCNVHGKEHGQKMRGEMVIIETRGDIGG
ncbi:hypothetical protein AYO43_03305 [Nitrospira sp. SCGC AG-212-E16]|nr:hypothetical protein AYO43_03305 [Nitrospira sp. SCGC AG-212-E16]